MSSGAASTPGAPPRIGRTCFQAILSIIFAIALIVATGRTMIRARTYKSHGVTIDDGFFLLAVITFLAGTVMVYVDVPLFYLEENVTAGLEKQPTNFIPLLILGLKIEDAVTTLLGVSIVSVKFSFLFFFRSLLRQQKKMLVWWWCIFAILVPTALVSIFAMFIVCAYWNQKIFGRSTLLPHRGHYAIFTDALQVKCVGPIARSRQTGVLISINVLDILTDAFLVSIPVVLLWNVRITLRRKLALGGILCLSVCTMIIAIIKVAGGLTSDGGVDSSWVLFWYTIEAAVAIIVVSFTAFRALFVAHQAMKYRSPAENSSTSRNFWSRKAKNSRSAKSLRSRELQQIPAPAPVLGGRKHRRESDYGGLSFDRGRDDMEMPLQRPGITGTQEFRSDKTPRDGFKRPSAESFV